MLAAEHATENNYLVSNHDDWKANRKMTISGICNTVAGWLSPHFIVVNFFGRREQNRIHLGIAEEIMKNNASIVTYGEHLAIKTNMSHFTRT